MSGYSIDWAKTTPANKSQANIILPAVSPKPTNITQESSVTQLPENDFPLTASASIQKVYKQVVITGLKNRNKISSYVSYPISDCDIISLKNGTEIRGKVSEITSTEIKYKGCDDTDDVTLVINKSEVTKIKYVNGITELINTPSPSEEQDYYSPSEKPRKSATKVNPNGKPYRKTLNGFAIASLVAAILTVILVLPLALLYTPLLLILIPLPVVLGIMALREINATPELYKGKGMALFGIIFGAVLTSIILLFLLLFLLILLLI